MDQNKLTNRLNEQQKNLLTTINKLDLTAYDIEPDIDNVDVVKFKKYIELHNKLKQILKDMSMEQHEIYTLINTYSGSYKGFKEIKNFIRGRNICIIKKIRNSTNWNKHICNMINKIKSKYIILNNDNIQNIISDVIYEILIDNINTFDILHHKISLDGKNNVNKFELTLDDQKKIIIILLKNNIIKHKDLN